MHGELTYRESLRDIEGFITWADRVSRNTLGECESESQTTGLAIVSVSSDRSRFRKHKGASFWIGGRWRCHQFYIMLFSVAAAFFVIAIVGKRRVAAGSLGPPSSGWKGATTDSIRQGRLFPRPSGIVS